MIRSYFRTTVLRIFLSCSFQRAKLYTASTMKRGETKVMQEVWPGSTEWCDPNQQPHGQGASFLPSWEGKEHHNPPRTPAQTQQAAVTYHHSTLVFYLNTTAPQIQSEHKYFQCLCLGLVTQAAKLLHAVRLANPTPFILCTDGKISSCKELNYTDKAVAERRWQTCWWRQDWSQV